LLGSSTGSDELHYLLEGAFDGDRISDAFLHDVYGHLSFATGPLYAALHEPCYAQGTATRWSAQRIRTEFGAFDPAPALDGTEPPVAAAGYFDDMYVPRELSVPTAEAIRGLRTWVTSEYQHDGLRVSNGAVLTRLIDLAQGLA